MSKNTEIERKFLVVSDAFKALSTTRHEIEQGYICREPGKTIRVRISDTRAFLTIKSSHLREGIARFEWEREIDLDDAKELMLLCGKAVLKKTRYVLPAPSYDGEKRCWEVDEFHNGKMQGSYLAEIELGSENEPFERPDWLGEEGTGQPQYQNSNMIDYA